MAGLVRATGALFKDAALNWMKDYAQSMGAALAFYTVLSIAPLLAQAIQEVFVDGSVTSLFEGME